MPKFSDTKRKIRNFYLFAAGACLLGYSWLMFVLFHSGIADNREVTVCIFRSVTDIPCPACGSSRAVVSLIHGDIFSSLLFNPFGIIIAALMALIPVWLGYDFISGKKTLHGFFQKTNLFLGKKTVVIALIIIVLGNWVWNIVKL